MSALSEHYAGKECPGDEEAEIHNRIWVVAARLANIAEVKDPHAKFELMQAIVALVESATNHPPQRGMTMPLDRIDTNIALLLKTKGDLIAAYDRIEELQHACRGLLGLLSVISRHPGMPASTRESLITSEAVQTARELVG
jgi:hypothetical protein